MARLEDAEGLGPTGHKIREPRKCYLERADGNVAVLELVYGSLSARLVLTPEQSSTLELAEAIWRRRMGIEPAAASGGEAG